MATIDVTIRGAGVLGLSAAWAMVQRGARVRIVDPGGPGAGASGGIVGALAPHVPDQWNAKKALQLESLLAAQGFWDGVAAVSGQSPGYGRTGRVQPLADAEGLDLARGRIGSARELWGDHAEWRVVDRPPHALVPPSPAGWWVHDTLSARVHPRRAVNSLAAALLMRGVEIVTSAPDQGAVLWATGWRGLLDLSDAFGQLVGNGVKGQAALLDHAAVDAPQVFVDGLHIVPHEDGTTAIGSTSERDFADPTTTDDQCEALVARARLACPALADAPVVERWAGVRPRARSRAPILGDWPGRPGHFVLNGGFKIGFGMAPALAEMAAGLVLGTDRGLPADFAISANLPRPLA